MLYANFDDLVALKDQKIDLKQSSHRSVKSSMQGNHHSPFRGQGLDFDSVREYVPGDDIRNIDWRVTARTGAPHLKLFRADRERQVLICVDMNASMRFGTRKTFKSVQAAYTAAILGWQAIARHDSVSGYLFGDIPGGAQIFSPKRSHKSFCTMLKTLATHYSENHSVSLIEALKTINLTAQTGSLIYLISDFLNIDADFEKKANLLSLNKRCDVIFISIQDPADRSLPPLDSLKFCNYHQEKLLINTSSLAGRKAYEDNWKKNQERWHLLLSKSQVPFIELSTESLIHRDLFLELRNCLHKLRKMR